MAEGDRCPDGEDWAVDDIEDGDYPAEIAILRHIQTHTHAHSHSKLLMF